MCLIRVPRVNTAANLAVWAENLAVSAPKCAIYAFYVSTRQPGLGREPGYHPRVPLEMLVGVEFNLVDTDTGRAVYLHVAGLNIKLTFNFSSRCQINTFLFSSITNFYSNGT